MCKLQRCEPPSTRGVSPINHSTQCTERGSNRGSCCLGVQRMA